MMNDPKKAYRCITGRLTVLGAFCGLTASLAVAAFKQSNDAETIESAVLAAAVCAWGF